MRKRTMSDLIEDLRAVHDRARKEAQDMIRAMTDVERIAYRRGLAAGRESLVIYMDIIEACDHLRSNVVGLDAMIKVVDEITAERRRMS